MPSVHILYGFTEGQWHGKNFRAALQAAGYTLAPSIDAADIILAHSGGCYEVPQLRAEQLLVLVNPTYWPNKPLNARAISMIGQMIKAVRPGNHALYHVNKTLHNLFYLPYHHRKNALMSRRAKTYNLERELQYTNTILVRNHSDPWLTPDLTKLQTMNPSLRIVTMPGEHDDLWLHPEPYIALFKVLS